MSQAVDAAAVRERVARPLPDGPVDPAQVVDELVAAVEPGLIASPGPRYFGFVIGGSVPAALAADWLVSAWDQNAFSAISSPAAAAVEEVALDWLRDLLGHPGRVGGRVRHRRDRRQHHRPRRRSPGPCWALAAGTSPSAGCRVRRRCGCWSGRASTSACCGRCACSGWAPAPPSGSPPTTRAGCGPTGSSEALGRGDGAATIVCAQVGEVNTGAVDPLEDVAALTAGAGAWLHLDGAFGLWAAASPALRPLVAGAERADSWATDAHKWLNVPYDCGLVFVRDPEAHRAAGSR